MSKTMKDISDPEGRMKVIITTGAQTLERLVNLDWSPSDVHLLGITLAVMAEKAVIDPTGLLEQHDEARAKLQQTLKLEKENAD